MTYVPLRHQSSILKIFFYSCNNHYLRERECVIKDVRNIFGMKILNKAGIIHV